MRKTTMTKSRPVRLFAIAVTLLCAPGIAHALGLGKLSVYTALNEPLKAEIRFTSLTEKEYRTLDARLITEPHLLSGSTLESAAPFLGIGITLVEREPKVYSLLLQSQQPMREPFLRLILEIEWAGGRLVREFTTLIDPRELRAPNEAGMPEFPPVANVGDFGRRDTEKSSAADSKPRLVTPTNKAKESTPAPKEPEVLTGENTNTPQPEASISQEPTVEITVSEPIVEAPASQPAVDETRVSTEPTLSAQEQVEAQRRLIQAEIENWAKERGLTLDKQPEEIVASDAGIETVPEVAVKAPEVDLDKPIINEPPAAVPASVPDSAGGAMGHDLLMVFVGLVAAVVLIAGGVLIRIYLRHVRVSHEQVSREDKTEVERETQVSRPVDQRSDDVEDLPEYGDRRSGYGRRQRFQPVEVERRQGPRRHRDRFAQGADEMQAGHANTVDESEVYMACGYDENAEQLLMEALAKDPSRQDLKVKLLAIYQHRGDPEAFDRLAGELYSDVKPKMIGSKRARSISEKEADQDLPNKETDAASDFDHSIEFDTPADNDTKGDDDAIDLDAPELADDGKTVDADVFEREIEALEMTVPTEDDVETPDSTTTSENEDLNDAVIESLQVDDFDEIKDAVDHGVDLIEPDKDYNLDDSNQPQSTNALDDQPARQPAKRSGNKGSKKTSVKQSEEPEDKSGTQWKEPSTKIDLAKAYIAMGDAERARSILDEVLEDWNSDDGPQG